MYIFYCLGKINSNICLQEFDKLTDETLNKAFSKVKLKFKDNKEIRNGFAKLRRAITSFVRHCEDNVEATIEIKKILDVPMVLKAGKRENKLKITIDKSEVIYEWKRRTWAKFFWDAFEKAKGFTKMSVKALSAAGHLILMLPKTAYLAIKDG